MAGFSGLLLAGAVTPAFASPYANYVFSGEAFDVDSSSKLNTAAGCSELRLFVPKAALINQPATAVGSMINTAGDNLFVCAGDALTQKLRFVVTGHANSISASLVDPVTGDVTTINGATLQFPATYETSFAMLLGSVSHVRPIIKLAVN